MMRRVKRKIPVNVSLRKTFTIASWSRAADPGKKSEDCVLVDTRGGLVGVFDGVGGRGNGRVASHLGALMIGRQWKYLRASTSSINKAQIELLLRGLVKRADEKIASVEIPTGQKRPGTTIVLAALFSEREKASMIYASVGDSRIYLLRAGRLQRLTEDDGYFAFALQKGLLRQEEIQRIEQADNDTILSHQDFEHFKKRNKITCAVGWKDFSVVHTSSIELLAGDCIILCSDGVHDNLTDQEIEEQVRTEPFATGAQRLVQAAYQRSQQKQRRSKPDDISAVLIVRSPQSKMTKKI
jgi:PPM family protein phosphatase